MRLLDAWALIYDGSAELFDVPDERSCPAYAILSHTWGHEEVLFGDLPLGPSHEISPSSSSIRARRRRRQNLETVEASWAPHVKLGWNKVLNTCMQACRDGFEYVWIDTCCIDKSSSAELSEARNSMYRWYSSAKVCYVLLADCIVSSERRMAWTSPENSPMYMLLLDQLKQARWFRRGWTLQELLAPRRVMFYDCLWRFIAERIDMALELEEITGIDQAVLLGETISDYSIAQRMFWASKRKTTRLEDEAYCLLGLFDINIPLMYGEGARAFRRLQEALVRTSSDQSILAWELLPNIDGPEIFHSLLAPTPANFWWHAGNIRATSRSRQQHQQQPRISWKTHGTELVACLDSYRNENHFDVDIAYLDCEVGSRSVIGFPLGPATIGLRLRSVAVYTSPVQPGSTDISYTQVEPESVSTIADSKVTYKRLAFLPPMSDVPPNHDPSNIFIFMDESYGCERDHRAMTSAQSTLRFQIDIVADTEPYDSWRPIAVWPRHQWFASSQTIVMADSPDGSFAALVLEHRAGFRCTLVIYYNRDQHTSVIRPWYWLLPGNPVLQRNLVYEQRFRSCLTWAHRCKYQGDISLMSCEFGGLERISLCEPLHQLCKAMKVIFGGSESLRVAWNSRSGTPIHSPARNTLHVQTSNYRIHCDYNGAQSTGKINSVNLRFEIEAAQAALPTGLGDPRGFAFFLPEQLVSLDEEVTYYTDSREWLPDAGSDILETFEAWGSPAPKQDSPS